MAEKQRIEENISFITSMDPELGEAVRKEYDRQCRNIELIASENIVSPTVMAAMGTVLTNKYAEGYPGKRYYGGCECVDIAENLAIERVCKLFGAKYANVQPHSGAQANMAVYQALCQPGDTVLGMSLDNGGHLTHGSPANQSGKLYNMVAYGVDDNGYIDYDDVRQQGDRVQAEDDHRRCFRLPACDPLSTSLQRLQRKSAHICSLIWRTSQVWSQQASTMNPMEYADVVTTTTHKTLRGPRGGCILTNDEALAKKLNSAIFPGTQGGPLMHIIAAKAVCFGEALTPEFKAYQAQITQERTGAGRRSDQARRQAGFRRHRQPSDAG